MARPLILLIFTITLAAGMSHASTQLPIDQDDNLQHLGVFLPGWFAELQDVEIIGDRAYVFGVGGLAIIDISDPTKPIELGRYEPPGHPYNRYYRGAVNGTLACGGARENRLAVIDISNPAFPDFLALHGIPGHSYEGAAMRGDYIYACRHDQGLEVVDITNPLLPVSAGEVLGLVNAWDVVLSGQHAFVADGAGGLAVVNIANPTAPTLVASVPTSNSAMDVEVSGGLAVVCTGSAGFDVFDISIPGDPVLLGSANTSGLAITAAIVGDLVYVADWDDVETFDISNPAAPVLVGGEDTVVRAMGLDANEDLVVVADWSKLRIYEPGPTTEGDIHLTVQSISFGDVPVGATVDTVFTIGNTGGGTVNVSHVNDFGENFTVLDPGPFSIPPGETYDVGLRFYHAAPGYDATFINIGSDDIDEGNLNFPVVADDDPRYLALGEEATDFSHQDIGGVTHTLSGYRGRVVVMAFFANW